MSIEVRCQSCGTAYALKPELIGRKVRCGSCGAMIQVEAPAHDSEPELDLLEISDDNLAEPRGLEMPEGLLSVEDAPGMPEMPSMDDEPEPDPEPDPGDMPKLSEDFDEEDEPAAVEGRFCAACGAGVEPTDTVCLACGADLAVEGEGLINQVLNKVPKQALIGAGALIGLLIVSWIGYAIWRSGRDDAFVAEGQALLEAGDGRKACEAFDEALEWDGTNLEAIAGAVEAVKLSSQSARLSRYAGQLNRLSNNRDVTIDEAQAADIYKRIAELALGYGNADLASGAVSGARRLGGNELEGIENLTGHVSFAKNDWGAAKSTYKRLVDKGTDDPLVYLNLARIEIRDGNNDKASGYIAKAQQAAPAEANVELARIREAEGKDEEAREHWRQAVEARGDLATARSGYGASLLAAGEVDKAFEQIEAARDLNSEDQRTLELRTEALYRLGRYDEALEQAESLLSQGGRDKSDVAEFYKGAVLVKQGIERNDSGLVSDGERLVRATVQGRDKVEDYLAAARLFSEINGKERMAIGWVDRALKLEPGSPAAHRLKVKLVAESDTSASRLQGALDDALKVLNDDLELNQLKADLYWKNTREDQREDAVTILRKLVAAHPKNEALIYDFATKLIELADDTRLNLTNEDRVALYDEALQMLEAKLQDELKATYPDLSKKIRYVKLRKLEYS